MFTFIESAAFERVCPVYLGDDEYAELQQFMMQTLQLARSSPVRVAFANYAGHGRAWVSAAVFASFISYLRTERVLDVDDLRQGQAGRRPRAYSEAVVGGISQ